MAAFGPDGFALKKLNGKSGRRNIYGLAAHGTQMHFHGAVRVIDFRHVLELRKIEIGVQIAIDASQQIQVECRSHSQFVVISGDELCARFLQIGSQQKGIAGLKNAPDLG